MLDNIKNEEVKKYSVEERLRQLKEGAVQRRASQPLENRHAVSAEEPQQDSTLPVLLQNSSAMNSPQIEKGQRVIAGGVDPLFYNSESYFFMQKAIWWGDKEINFPNLRDNPENRGRAMLIAICLNGLRPTESIVEWQIVPKTLWTPRRERPPISAVIDIRRRYIEFTHHLCRAFDFDRKRIFIDRLTPSVKRMVADMIEIRNALRRRFVLPEDTWEIVKETPKQLKAQRDREKSLMANLPWVLAFLSMFPAKD